MLYIDLVKTWVIVAVLLPSLAWAQANPGAQAARQWRQRHERAIVDEFIGLLKVPNVSSDKPNIQRNAELIAKMMGARGISAKLLSVPGGSPVVVGEVRTPGASRTIGLYAHYDGQPLDPKEWASPPFEPTLRDKPVEDGGMVIPLPASAAPFNPESRLYARGAGDDKAPIIAMLTALDAIRAAGVNMKSNVKFAFEGEEEAGSAHLEETIAANKDAFAADVWLICDGPVYQTRQQSLIFGARGVTTFDVTVYGPRLELHSGHYGNWAPNPATELVQLLASMKDSRGHVTIPGFYDEVDALGAAERKALADAPSIEEQLRHDFWLGPPADSPEPLYALLTQPSLNIRGLASSRTGAQASNVIPSSAVATIDVRLVKSMDIKRTQQVIRDYIAKRGFFVVDRQPTADERRTHAKVAKVTFASGATEARRTAMDVPIAQDVIRAVEGARGTTVKLPTMGATVPLDAIERPLNTRTIIVPIANHDDSQHTFNENLRIQNLWDGIELMAALLTM